LKIFTPKTLRETLIQKEFHDLNPDIAVVISYGLILPAEILNIPKFGCFNVHPSKLPLYRGSAPLQRSIMNGEKESAVCVIKMDLGVDSGDIVNQEDFMIFDNENYQDISKKTAKIGASLIIKTLNQIADKSIKFDKQNEKLATFAKKIEKNECLIDWNKSGEEIFNKIRGLNGNLFAHFNYNNEKMLDIKPNTIFIDPPWGGICYRKNDLLKLTLSDVPIEELVFNIFNKFRTINISPLDSYSNRLVVLKLPKNYDIENFYHYIKKNIEDKNYIIVMYVYILNKMFILVCEYKTI
jgi:folate-dependent phosphoribosylglycinamide formyltransferase PurN